MLFDGEDNKLAIAVPVQGLCSEFDHTQTNQFKNRTWHVYPGSSTELISGDNYELFETLGFSQNII